jgi:hypothetical protein
VETERRERGRYRRREGGKETEEKNKGEETPGKRQKGRDIEERQKTRIQWREKEERKEGIYRGETMESDRVEK